MVIVMYLDKYCEDNFPFFSYLPNENLRRIFHQNVFPGIGLLWRSWLNKVA